MQISAADIRTREVLKWKGVHLLHFFASSCSQKIRIFLDLKGICWESHPVNLLAQENYDDWFLGISPRGLVPVLVHDGVVHIESNDILSYLEKQFTGPELIPKEFEEELQQQLGFEDELHLDLRALTMRFVFPSFLAGKKPEKLENYARDEGRIDGKADSRRAIELDFWNEFSVNGIDDARAESSIAKFRSAYDEFESRLAKSKYLLGDAISLLDIAWFIYTQRLTMAGFPFAESHPRVRSWYVDLLQVPAFKNESKTPIPLRLLTFFLHIVQAARGKSLRRLGGF